MNYTLNNKTEKEDFAGDFSALRGVQILPPHF